MELDKIKDRVRKLMAVAGDGAASDGEIENAMRHAARLIDAHHLQNEDFTTKPEVEAATEFGRAQGTARTAWLSTWESGLAVAICDLFGCVQYYVTSSTAPVRVNGIVEIDKAGEAKIGKVVYFYGPLMESNEARDLFQEWSRSIASMAVIRWGGCFRGDGAMYAMGFVQALMDKAKQINESRKMVMAKPIALLGQSTNIERSITLTSRYDMLKDQGRAHLESAHKVKLKSGSARSGYRSGSSGAYGEGRAHGSAADFGRARQTRRIG